MSGGTLISVSNLSVSYDGKETLRCDTLKIKKGDFIGVIGPNGGGKTTLVKAILKSIPYKGEIIYSPEIESGAERRIGYLPQVSSTDKSFPIPVAEVVLSGLQSRKGLFGRYTRQEKSRAGELLELTSIKHLSSRNIGELSGGEFQRALLCRAIISDPVFLILDEPANFVDNKFEKELYAILKELNKRMTIMMVSHDIGIISSHIKSIVCVNKNVHYHDTNIITHEQLNNYDCPIQLVSHGNIPHTVLKTHE